MGCSRDRSRKKGDRVRSFGDLFGFQSIGRRLTKRIWAAGVSL